MREYKFRGKRLDNGGWLYGELIHLNREPLISDHTSRIGFNKAYVDPETVGQYTEMKDRNGVEIYEDDIIEVNGKHKRVVLWDKIGFALMPCEDYHDKTFWEMNLQHPDYDWWNTFFEEIEVIGNIHDNPELLKGGSR